MFSLLKALRNWHILSEVVLLRKKRNCNFEHFSLSATDAEVCVKSEDPVMADCLEQ